MSWVISLSALRVGSDSALVYIFVGTILLQTSAIRVVPGSIIAIVGVGYGVLEYITSIEPPQNMRDASGEVRL